MDVQNVKRTGAYAVVHFGPNDKEERAFFLTHDMKHFTGNPVNGVMFTIPWEAEMVAEERNKQLAEENHPLAGYVTAAEIFVQPFKRED